MSIDSQCMEAATRYAEGRNDTSTKEGHQGTVLPDYSACALKTKRIYATYLARLEPLAEVEGALLVVEVLHLPHPELGGLGLGDGLEHCYLKGEVSDVAMARAPQKKGDASKNADTRFLQEEHAKASNQSDGDIFHQQFSQQRSARSKAQGRDEQADNKMCMAWYRQRLSSRGARPPR
eukprot:762982-Hanusia_phi.AAC.3